VPNPSSGGDTDQETSGREGRINDAICPEASKSTGLFQNLLAAFGFGLAHSTSNQWSMKRCTLTRKEL
jgi:hypothetical protein